LIRKLLVGHFASADFGNSAHKTQTEITETHSLQALQHVLNYCSTFWKFAFNAGARAFKVGEAKSKSRRAKDFIDFSPEKA